MRTLEGPCDSNGKDRWLPTTPGGLRPTITSSSSHASDAELFEQVGSHLAEAVRSGSLEERGAEIRAGPTERRARVAFRQRHPRGVYDGEARRRPPDGGREAGDGALLGDGTRDGESGTTRRAGVRSSGYRDERDRRAVARLRLHWSPRRRRSAQADTAVQPTNARRHRSVLAVARGARMRHDLGAAWRSTRRRALLPELHCSGVGGAGPEAGRSTQLQRLECQRRA